MKRIVATAMLAVATSALGIEFDVPQGAGTLPTIALIECLAQDGIRGEGEYCRTTYECRDGQDYVVEGVLVEGMTYSNGRRTTLATDAIATQRSCIIDVADDARVSFFSAYRPSGRDGELVGLSRIEPASDTGATAGGGRGVDMQRKQYSALLAGEKRDGIWVGITAAQDTATRALQQAEELCQEDNVNSCGVVRTFSGPPRQCVGVALSRTDALAWAWALGVTHEQARERAMSSCVGFAESCYIWSSKCVPPLGLVDAAATTASLSK